MSKTAGSKAGLIAFLESKGFKVDRFNNYKKPVNNNRILRFKMQKTSFRVEIKGDHSGATWCNLFYGKPTYYKDWISIVMRLSIFQK